MEKFEAKENNDTMFAAEEIAALLLSAEALPEFAVSMQTMYSSLGTEGD